MTCLAASEVHSLIVSGSHDLTCILWDMEELSYITQLAGHTTSISALAINELTVSSVISNCFSHFFFLLAHSCHVITLHSSQHQEGRILNVDSMHILFFVQG